MKRFNVGDMVTYKRGSDCNHSDREYYYGGDDQDGFVGEILGYSGYVEQMDCWGILVTCRDSDTDFRYDMLESEFEEYNTEVYNGQGIKHKFI